MGIFQRAEWFVAWLIAVTNLGFEWDAGNWSKSAKKHGVSPSEVEEVFWSGLAVALGVQIEPHSHEERLAVVGPTETGRLIFVLFTLRGERIRPISARDADNWEKEYYEEN